MQQALQGLRPEVRASGWASGKSKPSAAASARPSGQDAAVGLPMTLQIFDSSSDCNWRQKGAPSVGHGPARMTLSGDGITFKVAAAQDCLGMQRGIE